MRGLGWAAAIVAWVFCGWVLHGIASAPPPPERAAGSTSMPTPAPTIADADRALGSAAPLTAAAPGGVVVSGLLSDATGGPIEGASIVATAIDPAGGHAFATTDDEGRFALHTSPGAVRLRAFATGYARSERTTSAPSSIGHWRLLPATSVRGRVVAADGATPLADATVTIAPERGDPRETVTDDAGRFAFDDLSAGTCEILVEQAHARGRLTVRLGWGESRHDVVVRTRAGARVTGRVVVEGDSTRPCPAGSVTLADGVRHATAEIDAHGRVAIGGVPPGRYEVEIDCPGYAAPAQREVVTIEDAALDPPEASWIVGAGLVLRGIVLDDRNAPVADAEIDLTWVAGEGHGVLRAARSDREGEFAITGLHPGTYDVGAEAHGYSPNRSVEVVLARDAPAWIELRMLRGFAVRGHVRTRGGDPVDGIRVVARDGAPILPVGTSDAHGVFVLDGVRTGSVALVAERGWSTEVGRTTIEVGAEDRDHEIVVAGLDATLHGRVVGEDEEPIDDALVWATVAADPLTQALDLTSALDDGAFTATDGDGSFAIAGLVSGRYGVRAVRTATGEDTVVYGIDPDAGAIVLRLRRPARVTGVVHGIDGAGVAEIAVTAWRADLLPEQHETHTDPAGEFDLTGLPAGAWSIRAQTGGTRPLSAARELELTAGQHATVDLQLAPAP